MLKKTKITKSPNIELEEVGAPHKLKWNRCKLETISFGHGITTTPLQATALYAAISNGGNLIKPSLVKNRKIEKSEKIISKDTSDKLSKIISFVKIIKILQKVLPSYFTLPVVRTKVPKVPS